MHQRKEFFKKALNKHSGGFGDAFNYEGTSNFSKITLHYYCQQFVMRDNLFFECNIHIDKRSNLQIVWKNVKGRDDMFGSIKRNLKLLLSENVLSQYA